METVGRELGLGIELRLACPAMQTGSAAPVNIMTEGNIQEKTLTEKRKRQ